jgi:ABC-type nitrate/sulfonate/bicarbonate transport system permease component
MFRKNNTRVGLIRILSLWGLSFIGVLLIWDSVVRYGLVSPAAFARPWEVAVVMPNLFSPSGNLGDVISTITRSLLAFAISVPVGIIAGCLIFFLGSLRAPASFMIDFLRSIPATALVPVFMILYGIGDTAKVAVGTFSSALVICVATLAGFKSRSITRLGVAKTLGFTPWQQLILVDIPESAAQIFLGLRTGISLALILVVVSEMLIGANKGLGKVIADMRYTDDKGRLYAALIVTGGIGYIFNVVLSAIETRTLHWRGMQ